MAKFNFKTWGVCASQSSDFLVFATHSTTYLSKLTGKALKQHQLMVHPSSTDIFLCEKCNCQVNGKLQFQLHMYGHQHGTKSPQSTICPICNVQFSGQLFSECFFVL